MLDNVIIEKIEDKVSSIIKSDDTDDTKIFSIIDYVEELVTELVGTESKVDKFTITSGRIDYTFTIGEYVIWAPDGAIGTVMGICPHFDGCIQLNVDGNTKKYSSCDVKSIEKISNDYIKTALKVFQKVKEDSIKDAENSDEVKVSKKEESHIYKPYRNYDDYDYDYDDYFGFTR